MNKEEYDKFCKEAKDMKCYDGRNTYDIYVCDNKECGNRIATTYAVKGVTPFTIKCPKCGKTMTHSETYNNPIPVSIQNLGIIKWVRPTYEQYCKLSLGMKEHVENGGLIMETTQEQLCCEKTPKCEEPKNILFDELELAYIRKDAAIAAMQGILANNHTNQIKSGIAKAAVRIADELINELQK